MALPASCNYCKVVKVGLLRCSCEEVLYCNKSCQRADWKNHKQTCPPFRLGTVGGKGKGLVATRRIAQYSVILEEDPVLVKDLNNNQDDRKLWEDFQNLSPSGFRAPGLSSEVLKLFDPQPGEYDGTEISAQSKLKRIMAVNSIKYDNKLTKKITQNLSSDTSNRCSMVALVTIEKNQELTVNYFYDLTDPRGGFCLGYHQRQQKLRNLFSFQCLCQVCQQGEAEDQLRAEYRSIDQLMEETFTQLNARDLLNKAENKLALGRRLDNQVLFRDLIDCLILLRFNLGFCQEPVRRLELTMKISQLRGEAVLAVKSYPDHLRLGLENMNLI